MDALTVEWVRVVAAIKYVELGLSFEIDKVL